MSLIETKKSTVVCNECNKDFSTSFNLRKHARKFHPDKFNTVVPQKTYKYSCVDCKKNFSHDRNFREHKRKHHGLGEIVRKPRQHYCPLCSFSDIKAELSKHFLVEHNITINEIHLDFNSFEEFILWKKEIEQNTKSQYVKQRGCFNAKKQISISYFCHRSGTFVPKGNSVRRLKMQGSNKINGFCPASLRVRVDKNNKCKAYYIDQHVGHDNDLGHLPLTLEEREMVAQKIAQRIPFNLILKEARHSETLRHKRLSLLNKRDLLNIKKCFGLKQPEVKDDGSINSEGLDDGSFVEEVEVSTQISDCEDNVTQPLEENSDSSGAKKYLFEGTDHIYANLNSPSKPQIEIIDETLIVAKEKDKILSDIIPNLIKAAENIFCMEQIEAFKKLCEPITLTLAEIESKYQETQHDNKLIQLSENINLLKKEDTSRNKGHSIFLIVDQVLNAEQ